MTTRKTLHTAALLLTAALTLTGCANTEPAPVPVPLETVAPNGTAAVTAEAPAPTAAEAPVGGTERQREIAIEAARIMTTWNPATDPTQTEAEKRARHLMTDARAARVVAPKKGAGGAAWADAAEAQATSVPEVQANEHTDMSAVEVTATWTWQTPDGTTMPPAQPQTIRYFTFMFDPEQPEKIAEYQYQDRPQG